jgi:reactive intermediate/imine deaminase
MEKQVVQIPGVTDGPDRYSAPLSPVVRAGDLLFTSGMPPKDFETGYMIKGDIEAQTRKVLDNLKLVLEASGSSLDKVVKTTVFCANAAYFGLINEIYREYFPNDFPARSFVTVGSWPTQFDVEIECVAIAG